MGNLPFRSAHRVTGVPAQVVAWVDHEEPHLLLLNADCFSARQADEITEALTEGRFTVLQVLNAFGARGG